MGIALAIGIPVTIAAGRAMATQLFGDETLRPAHPADDERGACFCRVPGGSCSGSARGDAGSDSRFAHGMKSAGRATNLAKLPRTANRVLSASQMITILCTPASFHAWAICLF